MKYHMSKIRWYVIWIVTLCNGELWQSVIIKKNLRKNISGWSLIALLYVEPCLQYNIVLYPRYCDFCSQMLLFISIYQFMLYHWLVDIPVVDNMTSFMYEEYRCVMQKYGNFFSVLKSSIEKCSRCIIMMFIILIEIVLEGIIRHM